MGNMQRIEDLDAWMIRSCMGVRDAKRDSHFVGCLPLTSHSIASLTSHSIASLTSHSIACFSSALM
jgi:hypothetical protein